MEATRTAVWSLRRSSIRTLTSYRLSESVCYQYMLFDIPDIVPLKMHVCSWFVMWDSPIISMDVKMVHENSLLWLLISPVPPDTNTLVVVTKTIPCHSSRSSPASHLNRLEYSYHKCILFIEREYQFCPSHFWIATTHSSLPNVLCK